MSFSLETTDMDLGDTAIENIFINDYMPMANGTYVKVYLLGFKYATDRDKNMEINNQTIAKHLQISLEDVLNAWDFWEEKGIIEKIILDIEDEYEKKYNYQVKFLSLKQLYIKNNYNVFNDKEEIVEYNRPREVTEKDVLQLIENPEINQMFNDIQHILRRPTQITEKKRILSWVQDYNMNSDVILKAIQHADSKSNIAKSSRLNYAEGTIRNWYDDGLITLEQVLEDFKKRDEKFYKYDLIMRSLGRYDLPTDGEKETIDTWFNEYGLDLDIILEACKSSTSTNNPNINYINGIIKNWKKEGLNTIEDIEKYRLNREEKKKNYRNIRQSLGIKRSLNMGEENMIDKWVYDYKLDDYLIIEACNIAIEQGKVNFNYINSILSSWKEKGVKNKEDIISIDKDFDNKLETVENKKQKVYRKKHDHSTKFHNFEQRSDLYSADELEDVARRKREEYVKRKLKGE